MLQRGEPPQRTGSPPAALSHQIPLSGNPPMAHSATLREQYWLNGQVPQVGRPAHGTVLPYTPSC
ncbi:hypothetical protein HW132_17035 [Brasilonema sp. CT11]|nr:hypothetical protein [Brasilonema sp. CT11]